MADNTDELFVREVEIGVANLDVSTDEGVVSTRAVVQRTRGHDRDTGQERELILVYDADRITALADGLRKAYERAVTQPI
jgi:hypothetical protein